MEWSKLSLLIHCLWEFLEKTSYRVYSPIAGTVLVTTEGGVRGALVFSKYYKAHFDILVDYELAPAACTLTHL